MYVRLQMLCDRLVDRFVTAGLMRQEYDRVKLHVTVMNTLYRKDPNDVAMPQKQMSKSPPSGNSRESFDATRVLTVCIT